MALYAGTTKVVADDCALGFSHFEKPAGTIASTKITIPALDTSTSNTYTGWAIAAGYGKIAVTHRAANNGVTTDTGAVSIMDLDGSNQIDIYTSPLVSGLQLGQSVAIHSKYLCVGVGDQDRNEIYLFNHDGTGQTIITGPGGIQQHSYGYNLNVVHNKLVVGAINEDTGNTNAGSVYIYDLSAANIAASMITLANPDPFLNGYFGSAIGCGCGRIVIGAPNNDNVGAAYVYDLHGNLIKKIIPQDEVVGDTNSAFAEWNTISVGSGRILIGAYNADVNGYAAQGAVYMYDLEGNYIKTIYCPDSTTFSAQFGFSTSVNEGIIVIGSIGNPSDQVHVYDLDGNLLETIPTANSVINDSFGRNVFVGSGRIVVSDYLSDGLATNQGEAYIYTFEQNFNTLIDQTGEGYV